ncbi:hypothetical protein BC940DRAFT_331629 [Gongronella butleri]|nr:hypothetical protein BC940DRAFT_331629 [Gongronella butleri]
MRNDYLNERLHEIKKYELTDDEVASLKSAIRTVRWHSMVGGLALSTAVFFFARSRRWRPLPKIFATGAGLMFGSQLGFASGAASSMKTLQSMSNNEHLMGIAKELRTEFLGAKGMVLDEGARRPRRMTQQEKEEFYRKSAEAREARAAARANGTDGSQALVTPSSDGTMDNETSLKSAWDAVRHPPSYNAPENDNAPGSNSPLDWTKSSASQKKNKWGDEVIE